MGALLVEGHLGYFVADLLQEGVSLLYGAHIDETLDHVVAVVVQHETGDFELYLLDDEVYV